MFGSLDETSGTISFQPDRSEYAGRSYSVYITGHVNVTQEIQEPLAVNFGPFTVNVLSLTEFVLENTAPEIDDLAEVIEVMAGTNVSELVGYPIDLQGDNFEFESWVTSSGNSTEEWITFEQQESFEEGLYVTLSPPINATEQVFDLELWFREIDVDEPLNSTYTL